MTKSPYYGLSLYWTFLAGRQKSIITRPDCTWFYSVPMTLSCRFQICKVVNDPKGEHTLDSEAKKWATKVAKENKAIHEYSRLLQNLITGSHNGDKKVDFQIRTFVLPQIILLEGGPDQV